MTKPLIRLREVTTFKEAHTVHETQEKAEKQVEEAVESYKEFYDELAVPYLVTKRPPWDTFAGAEYSIALDTLAPDGRTLQIGTAHNLGSNFAEVFDLTFETIEGEQKLVHQTSYGVSDRAIASIIMSHGDDRGLCFPPKIAPIQVVIVPIPFKDKDVDVMGYAEDLKEELEKENIRTELDDRDLSPGDKFYRWEGKGVPLRIEVGPNEVEENKITLVRRNDGEKTEIERDSIISNLETHFDKIFKSLKERAREFMENRIFEIEDLEEGRKLLDDREGIIKLPWCGEEKCGKKIEDKTGGDVLGQEVDEEEEIGECPICEKEKCEPVYVAKTF